MLMRDLANNIRVEPYHILWNNCLVKSFRFKRECGRRGIEARAVISFGFTRVARRVCLTIPIIHAWGEVDGRRIEVTRPLKEPSLWGTLDSAVRPLVGIWI